ncbi:hypothetical protein H2199_008788 [Coniosporium tulheliwenetii]|uniref:Uncharacterized protein n=1 Tax=Coniosporium tulheliwenetii TaxID=3383036 RepID=A0ACC2YIG6_9PEZI|nr:hypothetical protein H2199_008788 [Cladosporium sp. JES 115]
MVSIGVSYPIGNTCGLDGESMTAQVEGSQHTNGLLEEEHFDSVVETAVKTFDRPPMVHTIATHYAATLRELKFCGYNGSPVLWHPTAITQPMLYPLRHFHKLQQLVLSVHLPTFFDFELRDKEIIAYWVN